MKLHSGKRKYWIAAAALAACVLLWTPLQRAVLSARLALSLQQLASGRIKQNSAINEAKIRRSYKGRDYEALLYGPARSAPETAVVLVAGLSELGCYHPRLVALSRVLAGKGLMVIAPDIREFRDFQISAEPIEQILFWYKRAPHLQGGAQIQKTGLAGISYSGTLALIAAAKPEIRDSVGFVAAVGPYCSLLRCTRNWFAADAAARPGDSYPTRFYAKWIVMRSALEMVSSPRDRAFLHSVLDNLLLEKKVPPAGPELSDAGKRWYGLATMPANRADSELAQEIERYLIPRLFSQIEPEASLGKIKCPVFLIHGAHDDLIPSTESIELHRQISNSELLIVPFLTHTHPTSAQLNLMQKADASIDTLIFCYKFSRVIL
jgi:pimeloyl-ACP methyl ester carboxylesterase